MRLIMKKRLTNTIVSICGSLALCAGSCGALYAYEQSVLQDLIARNESDTRMSEFKDNETTLKLKLEVLDVINANRARHKLSPVQLDIFASRVASMTSSDAAKGKYSGHWNLRGEKPYHRYAFAGGMDHVSENASMMWSSAPLSKNYEDVKKYILNAHMQMYNETPPNDGHRKNILNPWHTHVGLGFSMVEGDFRYYEHFIDRHLEFDPVALSVNAGSKAAISGKVTAPGYGVFFVSVYYEPFLAPMTASDISHKGSYPDYTNSSAANLAFWDIVYDDATKKFSFAFTTGKKGLYYVHIYVKQGHTGKENPGAVTTNGLTPVSGIVIKAN